LDAADSGALAAKEFVSNPAELENLKRSKKKPIIFESMTLRSSVAKRK